MSGARPTASRRWCRVPAAVRAVTVGFGLLTAFWSVAVPLGEAPDEPAHLGLVLHLAAGNPYPSYDGLRTSVASDRLCRTYAASIRACPARGEDPAVDVLRRHPARSSPPRSDRPAWDEDEADVWMGPLNQMPQHPPLYYQAMAAVLRVERFVAGGPASVDRELALLRLVNVLLVAPLPLLAWATVRRLGHDDGVGLVAALLTLVVPQLPHIGSTLNNDNLLTLLGGILAVLLAGASRGDRRAGTAVAVGITLGVALLTKAFAVVFVPAVALAYLVGLSARRPDGGGLPSRDDQPGGAGAGHRRWSLRQVPPAAAPLAGALVVAGLVSAWWYVGVRLRTGTFTASVDDRSPGPLPPGFSPDVADFVRTFAGLFTHRFWGSFGWYSVRLPGWFPVVATTALVAAVGFGLARGGPRSARGARRGPLVVALVPVVLLGFVVFARAWELHRSSGDLPFIQGRYLFAGIVGLLAVAAVGASWSGRWAGPATLAVAVAVQAEALRRVLAGYWGGPGLGPRGQLRAMSAWSAWPTWALVVLALAGAASAVATGVLVWREAVGRGRRDRGSEGPPVVSALR